MENNTFKVTIIGSSGVGKTTFLNRMSIGSFGMKYDPTVGVKICPIELYTDKGLVKFNVYDCAGQERFDEKQESYWDETQVFMIMFDVCSKLSFKYATSLVSYLKKKYQVVPIILCANKVDCQDRKILSDDINIENIGCTAYYEISTKTKLNLDRPFLKAIQLILGENTYLI